MYNRAIHNTWGFWAKFCPFLKPFLQHRWPKVPSRHHRGSFLTDHQTLCSLYFTSNTLFFSEKDETNLYIDTLTWSSQFISVSTLRKPWSVCPSISLYCPFARSSSSFTQCSRGHSSWPTVFWPSRGKPLVCGAGSWRYGLIWPSVTGSQTVGIAAALAELLFSDHVAKAWRLL